MADRPIDRLVERIGAEVRSWKANTSIEQTRASWEALFRTRTQPADVERVKAGGVDAAWIAAPGVRRDRVLVYVHGGGYAMGSVNSHRDLIARLSAAADCRALGLDYRLAPEHPFPAALEDATAAYGWLLDQGIAPHRIALAGDSSGGGLTAATLVALRDAGRPLPAAAVLLSPWVDFEATGESYESRKRFDPMVRRHLIQMQARTYLAGKGDLRNPLAAPLHADLSGLPPLLIQVGDHETLLDDSRAFAEKARAASVDVTLEIWDEMIHVFQLFADELEEARRAIHRIGAFLREHVG
jgi:acetyl esterase/lipase